MRKALLIPGVFFLFVTGSLAQSQGDIIITEFMANPAAVADGSGEYIEIYNKRSSSFDLDGFILKDDDSDTHTIVGPLVIAAESFLVLGINSDSGTNGNMTVDYQYSGFNLTNSNDEIVLTTPGGIEIARVSWTSSSFGGSGVAEELDALSDVNNSGEAQSSNYSNATSTYGDGDLGSPGSVGNTDLSEAPTIRFSTNTETFSEDEGTVNISVILEDADGNTVDVDVVYNEPASSTESSDYSSTNTVSLSFSTAASGDETKSASFTIVSDSDYEGYEVGIFELSNLSTSGATVFNPGGDSTYTLNITDDDTPNVVINEVNKDPGEDADGDGSLSTADDEFIEIYNNEAINIDITDWYITESNTLVTFASGTIIKAKSAIVIFDDSANPTGSFGGSTVLVGDANFSLTNSGSTIRLLDNNDNIIDTVATGGSSFGDNQSITRDPDGTGTFVEHSTAFGSIGNISPGTKVDGSVFTTDIIIEGTAGWRLLTVPMENYDLTEVSDDTPIQGITGGDNSSDDVNVYYYDDSGAWEVPATISTQYPEGYGFALYFFNDDAKTSDHLPISLDVSGSEPSSDVNAVSLSSTATNGSYYTLVGNPFATNYSLSFITADDGDGIQNNVHFWDNGSGSYEAIDRTGPSVVSSWQGFWVEVLNDGSETTAISFPSSGKTFSAISDFHFSKLATNRADINFTLSSKNSFDKALRLSFRGDASLGLDKSDASKLNPLLSRYATLAFKSNNRLKSVESIPYNLTQEVSLDMEEQIVGLSGEFTLEWHGLESIPSDWELTFHDYEAGKVVDMRTAFKYVFRASAQVKEKVNPLSILSGMAVVNQKSKLANTRFGITIVPGTSVSNELESQPIRFALEQNYPNPFNPNTTIKYSLEEAGLVSLTVYNIVGQKVAELVNEVKPSGVHTINWNASSVASGMYYYRLVSGNQVQVRKMTLIK